jgi:hypothetical protein
VDSDEVMKQGDQELTASSVQFFESVDFHPAYNAFTLFQHRR